MSMTQLKLMTIAALLVSGCTGDCLTIYEWKLGNTREAIASNGSVAMVAWDRG